MASDNSVQSLDRGLKILRLLSFQKRMTATAIAQELEVHQSSASRMLNSLLKAGFVRKPDFHSFALDYGALVFGGQALECFPEIGACANACNRTFSKYGFHASVGLLRTGRVLYLTQVSQSSTISIIDDMNFPLHQSSIGLLLAAEKPREEGIVLIQESIERHGFNGRPSDTADKIYDVTCRNINDNGFFYQTDSPKNIINSALGFDLDEERAAVAVFHPEKKAAATHLHKLLKETVREILAVL